MSQPGKEIRVSGWTELVAALHSPQIIPLCPEQGNHRRAPYVFRGIDDATWELTTTLQRLPKEPATDIQVIERASIRSFRKYASAGTFDQKSEWYVLAVAQHNGLPTRCLDWAASPLVAAHFACADRSQGIRDGAIWCVHAGFLREINQRVAAPLQHSAWVYDTRLLEDTFNDLDTLDQNNESAELMLLWEPPSLDARIANQYGLLSVMNNASASQHAFLLKHSQHQPELVLRIVIEAKAKAEVREMLDQNNISERTLFPGLPGLCQWLKRYYGKAW